MTLRSKNAIFSKNNKIPDIFEVPWIKERKNKKMKSSFEPNALKPILKSALDANRPLIIWNKGVADSLDIYVDRQMNDNYVFLANDSQPDYLDTFPLPIGVNSAAWRYKAIYRIGDEQVGKFSDPITVTVTKQI